MLRKRRTSRGSRPLTGSIPVTVVVDSPAPAGRGVREQGPGIIKTYPYSRSHVGCLAQEFRGIRRPPLGERQELFAKVPSKGPELCCGIPCSR